MSSATPFPKFNAWIAFAMAVVFCLLTEVVQAQFINRGRYEKELKTADNGFTVVPLSSYGISMVREKNKYNDGKRLWELILLDTALGEKWQTDLELKSNYDMIGYEFAGEYLYYLFREGDKDSNKFSLMKVNVQDHTINQFEIKHEFALRLTHFTVVGENALFGGYVAREPAVMLYETHSQLLKVIPGFFLKDTELLDLRVNSNNTFNALLIERNSLDKKNLVIKTFDEGGLLLLEDYIELEKDINILTGISSGLKREELIILGTYTVGVSTEGVGFYSVLVDPYTDQKMRFYPFTTLANVLKYLPEKRAARIKSKSEVRMELGKTPDYKAHVLPIRIAETDEGFYFLSEMYDPVAANPRPYWNSYNSPYYGYGYTPYSYNPFMNRYSDSPYSFNNNSQSSSARMTESILTLFNSDGELVWDNSLKFDNVKRYAVEQTSEFIINNDLIFLTYKKESELFTLISSPIEDIELDTLEIPLQHESDVVRYETEEDSGVRYWYNNFSFVWGYQSLRNKERIEDPVRYVFYINKFEAE